MSQCYSAAASPACCSRLLRINRQKKGICLVGEKKLVIPHTDSNSSSSRRRKGKPCAQHCVPKINMYMDVPTSAAQTILTAVSCWCNFLSLLASPPCGEKYKFAEGLFFSVPFFRRKGRINEGKWRRGWSGGRSQRGGQHEIHSVCHFIIQGTFCHLDGSILNLNLRACARVCACVQECE